MEIKLIVAGGRTFSDYELMQTTLDHLLSKTDKTITIISGAARGADTLGEHYAKKRGFGLIRMPAQWGRYGRSAGYRRNSDMARIATHCVCFWDYQSRGTRHMIDIAMERGLNLRVIRY